MAFEPVIGLEIHAQLATASKIFCGCSTRFGDPPNTNVCPVCLGMPGTLPVLNRQAVEYAVRAALALNCTVRPTSVFARKNYFYPDLPKGYQISQYEEPLAVDGWIEGMLAGAARRIGIVRVHLEEDAGKSLHEGFTDSDRATYLDFNRCGVPLIEIVSRPDLRSGAEAAECFERLRALLVAIGVNDGNMEEGSLRCDANVSVRPLGETTLGVKTEVKNLNSFRFVHKALDFEIARQIEVLAGGGAVVQETRLWDAGASRTVTMRTKEEAHDYRYFPEPDLPPLVLDAVWIEGVRGSMPELPEARKQRLMTQYELPEYDADVLTRAFRGGAEYFEEAVAAGAPAASSSSTILIEAGRVLNELGTDDMQAFRDMVPPDRLAGLLRLVADGVITGSMSKRVLETMRKTGRTPEAIVESEGLARIDDRATLQAVVARVVSEHPGPVAQYRAGKAQTFGFLVGQAMKATGGKANPELLNRLLRELLDAPGA